jgi:L,D-peptidoglycan transpeptidase YkuD (ErfK/YbiS/YcfS/YnhG family)
MPYNRRVDMRRTGGHGRRYWLLLLSAGAAGVIALVVVVSIIIANTFPKPEVDAPGSASSVATTAISPSNTLVRGIEVTPTQSATDSPSTEPTPAVAVKPKPKPKPKPKAVAATPAPPLGMKRTLAGSKQMVIMTGSKLGSTHGTLRIFNLSGGSWKQVMSAPCRFGTYGLIDGNKRKEGSRTTPTGIWWPGGWVWGWHKKAPPGTKMPYRQTTDKIWWSWERNSTYNTWVVSSQHRGGEHLVDVRIQYEFAISTGYNAPPNEVVQGRGSAIFLHVFDPPNVNNGLSAGCIGTSRSNMIRVFRTLDPALKPSFAIGTEKTGTSTSIQAY